MFAVVLSAILLVVGGGLSAVVGGEPQVGNREPGQKGEIVRGSDERSDQEDSLDKKLIAQRTVTQRARTEAENARLSVKVAKIAVKEYEDGTLPQTRKSYQMDIVKAEDDLAKSKKRLDDAKELLAKAGKPVPADKAAVDKIQHQVDDAQKTVDHAQKTLDKTKKQLQVLNDFTAKRDVAMLKADVAKARTDLLAKKSALSLEEQKERKLIDQRKKRDAETP